MEVKVNTKQLLNALKNCNVYELNSIPILRQVMLKAEGNQLIVYGTDLEIFTTFTLPAEVKEEGVILVNHKKLLDSVKVIKDKEIQLRTEDDNLHINSYFRMKIDLEPDDFPLTEPTPDKAVSFNGLELLKAISKTTYAISKDDSRFALNGVCFAFLDKQLDFVATDGHRLALYSVDKEFEGRYILPKKLFKILKKLIKQTTEILFSVNENFAFFTFDNVVIQAELIKGIFPDYYQVIPESFNLKLRLDRYLFTNLLQEVISVINDKNKPIILSLKDSKLTVSNTDNDIHIERVYSLEESYPEFRIGFNGKFLLEAISCIDDRFVIVKFIDKDSQAVITPEDNKSERYTAVVMPMTI